MHDHQFIHRMFFAGSMILFAVLFTSPVQAADKAPTPPTTPSANDSITSIAAGTIEDSLRACLSRIPKDATAGQRMFAEQSCRRDDGDQKPFQATDGR